MVDDRRRTGDVGEREAAHHLIGQGFLILDRNVRVPSGEIDIVARDGNTTVFVEVRTRRSEPGSAALSLHRTKLRRMLRCALEYCHLHGLDISTARIDVIAIDRARGQSGIDRTVHYRAIEIPE